MRLASGETILTAARGVIAPSRRRSSTTRLLAHSVADAAARAGETAYRYGKGDMQIHYALNRAAALEDAGAGAASRCFT